MIPFQFIIALLLVVIFQFARAFSDKWANKQFEKIKNEEPTWIWLKVLKIPETKESFFKFARIVSAIVIVVAVINIIWIVVKNNR